LWSCERWRGYYRCVVWHSSSRSFVHGPKVLFTSTSWNLRLVDGSKNLLSPEFTSLFRHSSMTSRPIFLYSTN
jgi:hypothetical protein